MRFSIADLRLKRRETAPVVRKPGESWESLVRRRNIDHADPNTPNRNPIDMKVTASILAVVLFCIAIIGVAALVILSVPGCAAADQKAAIAAAQAKRTVAESKAKTTVQVNAIEQKSKLDAANAKANPVRHPVLAARQLVIELRVPLEVLSTLAFVALLIGIGLRFITPLSWLGAIVIPIAASVALGALTGLLVLPFLPWALLALVLLVVGVLAYEVWRYRKLGARGDVKAVITDFHELADKLPLPGTAPAPIVAK